MMRPMSDDPAGYYARLEVAPAASRAAITAAFRRRARVLHPDVVGTGSAEAFMRAKEAYDVLDDAERRAAYDRTARAAAMAEPVVTEMQTGRPASLGPRLSDLPIALWAGVGGLFCLAAVMTIVPIVQLTRPPPPAPSAAAPQVQVPPMAPGEAPAENLPQPDLTARTVALPKPPPATMPAGPPAEPADQPAVSDPAAPSIQAAMAPSSAGPVASVVADPATSDPSPSQDTHGPTQERLEAGPATAPPPASSQMAAGPAATSSTSPPAAAPLPPDIVAKLLERGAAMLAAGDISAARLLYGRAADAGSAQAAVAVGKTYEPAFLANKGTIGIQADPTIAAGWYRRAASLGAATAASLSERPAAAIGR
jgi:hypothetical protein